jgi:DNA gyrase subunit A
MTDEKIVQVDIVDEMKSAYLDYSMAVIVGRALPDLYDGLKPAQRRILTAMKWLGLKPEAKFMKSARITGETMGKLHPQGDCYGTLVNMSQWWTNNAVLVNGHGNFGSPTDGPASSRYTEAKLTEYAQSALLNESDTWETRPNYDNTLQEPVRLNVKVPHILLNGSEGIAVGMATKIPTHNLRGVAKALRALAEDDIITAKNVLAPDFPTGCHIVKDEGLVEYLNTGVGSVRMRAHCNVEELDYGKRSKRTALVFTNLPVYTNTEQVGDQIKEGIERGKVTTVADVRDETDRGGIRLVVVLKASADVARARAELFKNTSLDTKFSARNLVIDNLKPVQLAPHDMLIRWVGWRDQRLVVSLKAELEKRRGRLEVVHGLITAITMIDEVIIQIRASKDRQEAKDRLVKMTFTELQADAILDMRLAQLTKLDDKQLQQEAKEIQTRIKEILGLTSSEKKRREYIIQEVEDIAERHGNARRSEGIDPPNEVAIETVRVEGQKVQVAQAGPKTRYVLVDEEKGILTQLKAPRGAKFVIQDDQKMVFLCDNGHFYKVNARHRGPLSNSPTKILLRGSTTSLPQDPIVAVWKTTEGVFANVIPWEELLRTTSKGKRWLPDDAELVYAGTGYYELKYQSSRKKAKILSAKTLKSRPVSGKGNKVAKPDEAVV